MDASRQKTVWILGTHGVPACYGGFETAAEHIGRGLAKRGWRVVVYCQLPGRGPVMWDAWEGLERVKIHETRPGWLGTASFDLASIRHVLAYANSDDVCLTFGYNTGVFNVAQRLRRLPNVINMDGMEWTRRRWGLARQGVLLANERFAGHVGDIIIADHPHIAIYLRRHFGPKRVEIITYGAESCDDAPTDELSRLGLVPGEFATIVCRPIPENSVLEMVRAWSRRPRGHTLAVLGAYDESNPYHAQVLHDATSEVRFLGAIYDPAIVRALRYHSSVYLHGHTVGGTNPSLVEAMAAHNAVIAHDNVYNTWVAGPDNAYFRSIDDLDRTISRLLADPEARARMGRASFDRYLEEFTWDHITDLYEKALLRAMAGRQHRRPLGRRRVAAGYVPLSVSPGSSLRVRTSGVQLDAEAHPRAERSPQTLAPTQPISLALVGLGKMGLSHAAIAQPHPSVRFVGACDASPFVRKLVSRFTPIPVFSDYTRMLDEVRPAAVIVATPSKTHIEMVRAALDRGINVFCEKPLFIDTMTGVELTQLAQKQGLVTSVGYHNRFVATFEEVKKLLVAGAIGDVTNALAEAYGPVVLAPTSGGWRSDREAGGGCLFDYAAHPVDLLAWYFGPLTGAQGSRLDSIFSAHTDDAVSSILRFGDVTAQLSVNWSDESQRKMATRITVWGRLGLIYADRQEIRVYLRGNAPIPEDYHAGWNVKYTTELTPAPYYYLRGEEYSAQLDDFFRRCETHEQNGRNTFSSGSVTDRALAMIVDDARGNAVPKAGPSSPLALTNGSASTPSRRMNLLGFGQAISQSRRSYRTATAQEVASSAALRGPERS